MKELAVGARGRGDQMREAKGSGKGQCIARVGKLAKKMASCQGVLALRFTRIRVLESSGLVAKPAVGAKERVASNGGDGERTTLRRRTLLVAILLLLVAPASGLRNVRISVPEAVRRGETVRLACDYDLEMAPLYSIKWYRGDEEFYRYVPKEAPPTQVFPLPGISVDVSRSNAKEVHLSEAKMALTGVYKCEVSADAPFFHTDIKSALMVVVDYADELPILIAEKRKFGPGERIRANCTSAPSYPAANLTWFLNGRQIPESATLSYPVTAVPLAAEDGSEKERQEAEKRGDKTSSKTPKKKSKPKLFSPPLETTVLGLDLDPEVAWEHMYPRNGGSHTRPVTLRCLATLFGLYRRATEEHLTAEDSPKIASVVLGSSRKEAASSAAHPRPPARPHLHHGGTIGILARYDVNGAALMALVNVFLTVNAVGWR